MPGPLFALGDLAPTVPADGAWWAAPTAALIGNVVLHRDASVWWGAVLRGDNEPITIGEGSNVQDNAVLHTDMGSPLTLGRHVTVVRIEEGLHDLVLSAPAVREQVLDEMARFVRAYVPEPDPTR